MIIPIPVERTIERPPMMPINGLILRLQPFSEELKEMCEKYPDFEKSIKSLNSKRFISFGAILISYPKNIPEDKVIGVFVYDYIDKIFKQDFIVDVGSKNKEYIMYTKYPGMKIKTYLRPINEFFVKYPGYSRKDHHPKFDDIPKSIQPRALHAVKLAELVASLETPDMIPFRMYVEFSWSLIKSGL